MNDWWLSCLVNELANGVSQANSKAFVLTMIPTSQQAAAATIIDSVMAACVTLAASAYTSRSASGWHYLSSSPMQAYNHT
jgi:hypothetical protein